VTQISSARSRYEEFEVRAIFGVQKHACGRTIILSGEDRRQSMNYVLSGY
jgi:hypothetical protein